MSARPAWRAAVVVAALASAVCATPTHATEVIPTAQAVAANAAWLAYAPPPPHPVSVCLVDTGVDLNADTEGAVVVRDAVNQGSLDDVDTAVHHGTRMAMMMAAPVNGTGMVGLWPPIRVMSIDVGAVPVPGGEVTFPFVSYARAIHECLDDSPPSAPAKVIELALASKNELSSADAADFRDVVSRAHAAGLNIVAAAGNDGGALGAPAGEPGVLAVGASDDTNALCGFSSRGAGLALAAPGCHLDTADPMTLAAEVGTAGTSQASALVAAALAAVRGYDASLSWAQAEQVVEANSTSGVLDVAATFRADGLGSVVDQGTAATPGDASVTQPNPNTSVPQTPAKHSKRPPRPRVEDVSFRRGVVTVVVTRRPRGVSLRVTILRWTGVRLHVIRSVERRASIVRVHVRRPSEIRVAYVDSQRRVSPARVTMVESG